mgnify:FL=1
MENLIYRPLDLVQRSEDWLAWRTKGIGASEASVIMGSLPFEYEDILELYKKKAGLPVKEFEMNAAIQKGIDTEDEALEAFTKITNVEALPKCFTHPVHTFLRASLDGITEDLKQGVEIKCSGASRFYEAKKGHVLPYYYTQMQQQMACTGLESIYYWMYRTKEGGVLIKVPRNEEYINELIRRAGIFWDKVVNEEPCLPRHIGIDMWKEYADPFEAGDMSTEFIGHYKNEAPK